MNQDIVSNWKGKLNDLIKNKSPDKIYKCDETALFWKLLPSKTLHLHQTQDLVQENVKKELFCY